MGFLGFGKKKGVAQSLTDVSVGMLPGADFMGNFEERPARLDSYLFNAWVNIAVGIVIRNIARADFVLVRNGERLRSGSLYDLFKRPNCACSRFDLWKETAAWWHLEGEAFWWFGSDYKGGLPDAFYVLDPRRMRHEFVGGHVTGSPFLQNACSEIALKSRRWFYQGDTDLIPIPQDELIHFRDWNPWNAVRGVNPLAALALELEQDYFANKANSQLLKGTSKNLDTGAGK
jgi:phage portal protein BeeE